MVFVLLSLVPSYYLPQCLDVTIGSFVFPLTKYYLVGAVVVAGLCQMAASLPEPRTLWWAAVLASLQGASLMNATQLSWGVLKWAYFDVTGVAVFVLTSWLQRGVVRRLSRGVVVISATVGGYGVFEYLLGDSPVYGSAYGHYNPIYSGPHRASSSIGNAVALGGYLCAVAPLSWALLRRESRFWLGWALVVGAGVVVTFSRSAWAGLLVSALVYFWPSLGGARQWVLHHRSDLLVGMLVVLLAQPIVGLILGERAQEIPGRAWGRVMLLLDLKETQQFRLAQYGTTLNVLRAHPLLGVGFGNFTRVFDEYKSAETPVSRVHTTESQFLMVACEGGLLGLAGFLAILGWILRRLIVGCRSGSADAGDEDRQLRRAYLAAFCGILVNMLFWDALNFPAVRFVFWMVAGMGVALAARREPA